MDRITHMARQGPFNLTVLPDNTKNSSSDQSNLIWLDLRVPPVYRHSISASSQVPWYGYPWPFAYSSPGFCHSTAPHGASPVVANCSSHDGGSTGSAEHPIQPVCSPKPVWAQRAGAQVPEGQLGEGEAPRLGTTAAECGSAGITRGLKRIPTPHPQRKRSVALTPDPLGGRSSLIRNAPARTVTDTSSTKAGGGTRRHLKADQRAFMSEGRPLWSGNFSGANSPKRVDYVVRPNFRPSEQSKSGKEGNRGLPQDQTSLPSSSAGAPHPAPAPSPHTSVQYVNYNYRPVVVQSPTCGGIGMSASEGAGQEECWRLRHRTTSTLEAAPAVKEV